ncbi:periplasmic heavy metal sensor [Spongiibacter sp.]|uniref:periplasmic heavy metal sensor n=1 Tax=Spongiibacter sp. TaxID=2024860 RepID=UPI003568437B
MNQRRLLLAALVLSLVTNGVVVGAWLGYRWQDDRATRAMSWHILKQPPRQLSDQARAVLKRHRGEMRAAHGELRKARRQLSALLAEPTLDRVALIEAFSRLREADMGLKRISHEVMAKVLPEMAPEQRLAMLQRHRAGLHGPRRDGLPPQPSMPR